MDEKERIIQGYAPSSLEYPDLEEAVLGACLIDGSATPTMLEYGITEEHFTSPVRKMVYRAIRRLFDDGMSIDLLTVNRAARKYEGQYPSDFPSLTAQMTIRIGSAAHLPSHCMMLDELRIRRESFKYSTMVQQAATEEGQEKFLQKLQELTNGMMQRKYGSSMSHVCGIVPLSEEQMERRMELAREGRMSGITTGLRGLDKLINGWQDSALNIVAGRPGMGKTAAAMHFAIAAAKQGKNVCVYSLEMSSVRLSDRMLMALADGMDDSNFRSGKMTEADVAAFNVAKERLSKLPIYVDDQPVCTTGYIRANAMKMKGMGLCDLIIIDYLQLTDMTTGADKQYNREQQVSKASREYKILAKELDVPVILLSQLSRAVETRATKRPQLSDLRESGSIEQDADVVMFVYRPEYYGEEGYAVFDGYGDFHHGIAMMIVEKQREGATGEVKFCYNRSLTKIWDGDDRP